MKDKTKIRSSCKKCTTTHSRNEHRFHGYGSFAETHVSYCRRRCCETQKDSRCYVPKLRKKIAAQKNAFWNARGRK